jgi:hypothetical protein
MFWIQDFGGNTFGVYTTAWTPKQTVATLTTTIGALPG